MMWAVGEAVAEPLTIMYEIRAPYTVMVNHTLTGLVGDPIANAVKEAGIDVAWQEIPFKRELRLIESNKIHGCAAGRLRNAAREKVGKFSAPVYRDKLFVLLVAKGNAKLDAHQTLTAVLNDPAIHLLVQEGYSYGEELDPLITHARAQIVRLPYENTSLARMVVQGQVDAYLMTQEEAEALEHEMKGALVTKSLADAPPGPIRYLYCSKSVSDDTLERLNRVLPPVK
ncbi:MAG: transporter substrate-binding domain-containing protein [Burkholderiales bacterium]|nr:transporter substrate-binding domain-containing protein [Burkholderiales bacterium]